jgi:Fur family transcriptional regulator, ferric uptake regulator
MHETSQKPVIRKNTKHKLNLLKLFNQHNHLDANQIYDFLNKGKNKVSLATIYRLLATFEDDGTIIKNNFTKDHAVYEIAKPDEHHDHIVCINCGIVVEFFNKKLEDLQDKIAKDHGFEILSHELNLYGICAICSCTKVKC